MSRRGWWLVVLNLFVPGSAQVVAGNRRLGRFGLGTTILFWLLLVAALVLALAARSVLLSIVTNSWALIALTVVAAFYAVLWTVLTLDTLRLVRFVRLAPRARGIVAAVGVLSLVVSLAGGGFVVVNSVAAIGLLGIFSAGPPEPPVEGRYNILLLGGDAGPDRMGLRPDSISVVSIDATTGAAVIFGIPRNMERVPFADGSPLWNDFPGGYDCGSECLISYLYTYGEEHPDLYPDALANGSRPGVEATRDAVEGVLGLEIPYYVLIDMEGFADLIDALGGIEIDVPERVPFGSNTYPDGSPAPPGGYFEVGLQHMDGTEALWYARARYGTTDYARMARQRAVQEAILRQFEPATLLVSFRGVADAGREVVSTDIPSSMLAYFVGLAEQTRELPVQKIDFAPPLVPEQAFPDFAFIQSTVDEALLPVTPTPTPG
jgi:LCP family protein required for cell wall assembly